MDQLIFDLAEFVMVGAALGLLMSIRPDGHPILQLIQNIVALFCSAFAAVLLVAIALDLCGIQWREYL